MVPVVIPVLLLAIDLGSLVVAASARLRKQRNGGTWPGRAAAQFWIATLTFFLAAATAIAIFVTQN